MRVLFLSDHVFTKNEHEMLARLAIGLADEGTGIVWSVPEHLAAYMSDSLLVPIVPHQNPRLGLSTKRRAAELLDRIMKTQGKSPDIVHVFGGGVCRLAAEAARAVGALPVFEIWRPHMETTVRLAANRALGADVESKRSPMMIVPNEPIASRVVHHFPDAIVRKIPWGVHALRDPNEPSTAAVCMLLMGPGRDARAWESAFRAAIRVMRKNERFHLFADAGVTRRLRAWSIAREAGVLERLSLIDDPEARRDLVLRTDILLYSDARGESRSILLDAMASRVAVIAAADPLADALVDGQTARLVADVSETQWQEAIEQIVNDHAARRRLIESAAEFVQKNHRATRQIVSLIDAYEWIAGDPVRIGPDPSQVLGRENG